MLERETGPVGETGPAHKLDGDETSSYVESVAQPDDSRRMRAVDQMPSPLRRTLDSAAESQGMSAKDLTVLAPQNDPFRIDTPARHRDGEWLATTARELGLGERKMHLRGLHYMVIGRPKPDGTPYTNTESDWSWLSCDAGKAARWLGYIPFDQIVDQRNAAPEVRIFNPVYPRPLISVGIDVDIPSADELEPRAFVMDFKGVQPYKLVMFGEKSSLGDVLTPLASSFGADLYLPTGEISDTLLHQMASIGAADGRPMVVLCFSDADPSGWQMPISIARKLQAFKVLLFGDLDFQVHRVALTPDQVRVHRLPSTPLKDTEKRADKWTEAMGVQQTEIDALASLQPRLLEQIARDAIKPFYDYTLDVRVQRAQRQWETEAQTAIEQQLDTEHLEQIRTEAEQKLDAMRDEIQALNDALQIDVYDFDLPTPVVPTAQIDPAVAMYPPLLDSGWSFTEQCRHLIDSKAYRNGDGVR